VTTKLNESTEPAADANSSGSRQERLVNVRWHYYRTVKNCPAWTGFDDDCICWQKWRDENPAEAEGWKLVPERPTQEMVSATLSDNTVPDVCIKLLEDDAREIWAAMLTAAPQPEGEK